MKETYDYLKARPILLIGVGILALALIALVIFLGARIWAAIAVLFGVGAGTGQIAHVLAKKDEERLKSQAEIDAWKKTKLSELDQTRMKVEKKEQAELQQKLDGIDRTVETSTPEQMRERLLKMTKKPFQAILWGYLLLSGCSHTVGAPGGAVVRDVCFSKAEIGEVMKRLEVLEAAIKSCKTGAIHDKTKASIECQALVARWQLEARICSEKLTACSAKTCPTCWLPWLIVGVVSATAIGVGVYAGVHLGGIGTR